LRQGFQEGEILLRPQRRIKAKWASLVGMLLKWERLRAPIARVIPQFPSAVTEKIPTAEEKVRLEELTKVLKDFESVAKGLQGGGAATGQVPPQEHLPRCRQTRKIHS
jgi:hypothetical protein